MEYHIPDLLDCLQEVKIDIQPQTGASTKRIKELTMKKIHSENRKNHRSLAAFTKVLIAAAVLASLAIPVMAATGFHFSDWVENMFSGTGDYDSDLQLGSESKNWELSGWVFNLEAENADETGMTLVCDQWDTVHEKSGKLTTDESYFLEVWNGEEYEKLPEPKKAVPAGKTISIEAGSKNSWNINWESTYGALDSGSYRLGKNFVYTSEDGKQESVTSCAKFRVFTKEMTPYIAQCKAALEGLRTQNSYHITETNTAYQFEYNPTFAKRITNQWKNGEDYLTEDQYYDKDGKMVGHRGYLMRNGKGYQLTWNGDNVMSGVSSWETVDYLDDMNRDLCITNLTVYDANVAEVYGEENTIHLLSSTGLTADEYAIKQSFTTNQAGKLVTAQMAQIPSFEEPEQEEVYIVLEVHDTAAAEIEKVLAAQVVDKPVSFSWVEEQAAHPAGSAGVKTEGFVNTTSQGTVTLQNVVAIAQKECTLEWQNTAVVSYDEIENMWKVELGFSQDDTVCQTVYLNAEGITQLVTE